jgi:hypothetical protein
MGRKVKTILAHSHGLESRKISGGGRSVFLDFSFYRTSQDVQINVQVGDESGGAK